MPCTRLRTRAVADLAGVDVLCCLPKPMQTEPVTAHGGDGRVPPPGVPASIREAHTCPKLHCGKHRSDLLGRRHVQTRASRSDGTTRRQRRRNTARSTARSQRLDLEHPITRPIDELLGHGPKPSRCMPRSGLCPDPVPRQRSPHPSRGPRSARSLPRRGARAN